MLLHLHPPTFFLKLALIFQESLEPFVLKERTIQQRLVETLVLTLKLGLTWTGLLSLTLFFCWKLSKPSPVMRLGLPPNCRERSRWVTWRFSGSTSPLATLLFGPSRTFVLLGPAILLDWLVFCCGPAGLRLTTLTLFRFSKPSPVIRLNLPPYCRERVSWMSLRFTEDTSPLTALPFGLPFLLDLVIPLSWPVFCR